MEAKAANASERVIESRYFVDPHPLPLPGIETFPAYAENSAPLHSAHTNNPKTEKNHASKNQ